MKFLLESLKDLDAQLRKHSGRLYMFKGNPTNVFRRLWEELGIKKICFEQDCEPIWSERDKSVVEMCSELGIECVEKVSHTLWDPKLVIRTNGGIPPLTYQMFMHTTSVIGPPPRPCSDIDFTRVHFGVLPLYLCQELKVISDSPTPEDFGLEKEEGNKLVIWVGGETRALKHLESRVQTEQEALASRILQANQTQPNLLSAPTSQSAALRFGCLSIRRFYWTLRDLFNEMYEDMPSLSQSVTSQLIWREYFYTMSVDNPYYAEMERNPICLKINWLPRTDPTHQKKLDSWKNGMTGYPFIDAVMRQLRTEGWVHHVARNAVACFLTRGDLWISWEDGLEHFLKYLLDADWSVCAGNWMYVSSSAFEQLFDCTFCICPVSFGRRFDPYGEYVKRYVNEVRKLPVEYIYEPWTASIEVQEQAGCVIGRDYPERIVDHNLVSRENSTRMESIRKELLTGMPHCCPTNTEELMKFMWLPPDLHKHISKTVVDECQ
uniref:Cryptochrome-1 n=1 Tax=Lygus hesperus TaxID=30085 RepID=A0A0A9W7T6_LYGHE